MNVILAVLRLGIRQFLRNRTLLFVTIVLPLLLTGILGAALGRTFGGGEPVPHFIVAVYAPPALRTIASEAFGEQGLTALPGARAGSAGLRSVSQPFSVQFVASGRRASILLESGQASAAVLWSGTVHDPVARVEALPGKGIERQIVRSVMDSRGIASLLERANPRKAQAVWGAVRVVNSGLTLRAVTAAQYYAFGMLTFVMLFWAPHSAAGMVSDEVLEIRARMATAPIWIGWIAVGHFLTLTLENTTVAFLVLFLAHLFFGVDYHNSAQMAVMATSYAFAIAGAALFLAGLFRRPQTLMIGGTIVVQLMGALGGSFFSLSGAPAWAQVILSVLPNHWALQSMLDIAGGVTWSDLALILLALFGSGLAFGVTGVFRYAAAATGD